MLSQLLLQYRLHVKQWTNHGRLSSLQNNRPRLVNFLITEVLPLTFFLRAMTLSQRLIEVALCNNP